MKTIINIGTNKKNIVGVEFDKPFSKITYSDVYEVAKKHYPDTIGLRIYGWAVNKASDGPLYSATVSETFEWVPPKKAWWSKLTFWKK